MSSLLSNLSLEFSTLSWIITRYGSLFPVPTIYNTYMCPSEREQTNKQ